MTDPRLGLNPFKKGKKSEVEGVKKVNLESYILGIEDVVEDFKRKTQDGVGRIENQHYLLGYDFKVLEPIQITNFLRYFANMTNTEKNALQKYGRNIYSNLVALGKYTTGLIKTSYAKGHNDFTLFTEDIPLFSLLYKLKGKQDNPLNIKVYGDVGADFAREATHSNIHLEGDVMENLAINSYNLNMHVRGNTGMSCCAHADKMNLYLEGKAENFFASYSINSNYTIKGDVDEDGFSNHAKFCDFKVYDPDLYMKLSMALEPKNKLYLLDREDKVLYKKDLE